MVARKDHLNEDRGVGTLSSIAERIDLDPNGMGKGFCVASLRIDLLSCGVSFFGRLRSGWNRSPKSVVTASPQDHRFSHWN